MKKILIITSLMGVVLLLLYVSFRYGKKDVSVSIVPSPTPVIRPTLLPTIDQSLSISGAPHKPIISVAPSSQQFPEKLPVFRISQTVPDVFANLLAKKLGFTTQPITTTTVQKMSSLTWKENTRSLTVRLNLPLLVSYIDQPSLPVTPSGATTKEDVARRFLQALLPSAVTPSQIASQQTMVSPDGNITLEKTGTPATILNFTYTINGYRIYTSLNDIQEASIFLDQKPTVFRASFTTFYDLTNNGEKSLASEETAIKTLQSGGGILTEIKSNIKTSYETNPSPDYKSVTISKTSLGYFYFYKEGFLYPVYVFEGNAKSTKRDGGSYRVTYVVRATQ